MNGFNIGAAVAAVLAGHHLVDKRLAGYLWVSLQEALRLYSSCYFPIL